MQVHASPPMREGREVQRPLVSVIMIFLDEEPFIEEAIESVLAQSWPHWELLLVDDGSSDQSTAIAQRYAGLHPDRIRYLEHSGHANRGLSATRNLGIAHSRGDYLAFLDADDVYLPERLERHIAALEANPDVDMVQSDTLRWQTWSNSARKDRAVIWPSEVERVMRAPSMLCRALEHDAVSGWIPCTCSITMRRSAALEVGGFDVEFSGIGEDWAFISKVYCHKNIYVLKDVLAKYRKRADSTIARSMAAPWGLLGRSHALEVAYLRWLRSYLEADGTADPELLRLVRRKL